MITSDITNIIIPLIIPRYGKGHSEVTASVKVSTPVFIDTLNFCKVINKYAKSTCTKSVIVELVYDLVNNFNLTELELFIDFTLYIDRVSISYDIAFYEIECGYYVRYYNSKCEVYMKVKYPVFTQVLEFRTSASLQVCLNLNELKYFEEIVNFIQSTIGVALYPAVSEEDKIINIIKKMNKNIMKYEKSKSLEDREKILNKLSQLTKIFTELSSTLGKLETPYQYLMDIKNVYLKKNMGNGGKVSITFPDTTSNVILHHQLIWKK